jgi:hypothetical protein
LNASLPRKITRKQTAHFDQFTSSKISTKYSKRNNIFNAAKVLPLLREHEYFLLYSFLELVY